MVKTVLKKRGLDQAKKGNLSLHCLQRILILCFMSSVEYPCERSKVHNPKRQDQPEKTKYSILPTECVWAKVK